MRGDYVEQSDANEGLDCRTGDRGCDMASCCSRFALRGEDAFVKRANYSQDRRGATETDNDRRQVLVTAPRSESYQDPRPRLPGARGHGLHPQLRYCSKEGYRKIRGTVVGGLGRL